MIDAEKEQRAEATSLLFPIVLKKVDLNAEQREARKGETPSASRAGRSSRG